MSDIYSVAERSKLMAAVRSTGNRSTEIRLIHLMRAAGIRGWRRNSTLPGRPDFIFPTARLAIFVDGCFWHGCKIHGAVPAQNAAFWERKIARNRERDRIAGRKLRRLGWKPVRIWEHALTAKYAARTIAMLFHKLSRSP
jgi:DNA mismatch endonuclease, patch repair protein